MSQWGRSAMSSFVARSILRRAARSARSASPAVTPRSSRNAVHSRVVASTASACWSSHHWAVGGSSRGVVSSLCSSSSDQGKVRSAVRPDAETNATVARPWASSWSTSVPMLCRSSALTVSPGRPNRATRSARSVGCGQCVGVDADVLGRELLDVSAVVASGFEIREGVESGPLVDEVDVGVGGVGEVLGAGPLERVDEVVLGGCRLLARQWDGVAVVAFDAVGGEFVEVVDVGLGEHDEVVAAPSGEVDVGGLSVEAVEADGDRLIPGAALRSGGRDGVGVIDSSAVVEVSLVDGDELIVVVASDGEPPVAGVGDGAELAVGDGDELSILVGRRAAVASQDDSFADAIVGSGEASRRIVGELTVVDE